MVLHVGYVDAPGAIDGNVLRVIELPDFGAVDTPL